MRSHEDFAGLATGEHEGMNGNRQRLNCFTFRPAKQSGAKVQQGLGTMGYDIHITRANDWTESQSFPISLEEWNLYIRSDPEMRLDGFAEVTTTEGESLRYENPGLAVWIAYSKHDLKGNKAWFDFRREMIVVKNPDDEILAKMKQIAAKLSANVIGDEGETY